MGVASRSGFGAQAFVGWEVKPKWTTRREARLMMKKVWIFWKNRSISGRKLQAETRWGDS